MVPHNVAHLDLGTSPLDHDPLNNFPQTALDDFANYCLNNMDPSTSEHMISYVKQFQNRGREAGPAELCKHAACLRTHPINECCICRGLIL
jgi:hypothetical protein